MLTPSRGTPRNDRGDNLPALVIAMFVIALLVPGLLVLLTRSQQLATTNPDWDEGIQARAELAELFGSVDPIGQCASPADGSDAAYRDRCFREHKIAGASLIAAPALLAANPAGYGACWLTTQEDDPLTLLWDEAEIRQRRCIMLEGDSLPKLQCVDTTCLKVPSKSNEADGEPVLVDQHGGGRLLVRTWDEDTTTPTCSSGVPFLPPDDCFTLNSDPDRLIYTDVEWWCLRWRSPSDGLGGVTVWEGRCPAPADPCERIPPEGTRWDSDWSTQTATWTASTTCPQHTPALPTLAQAAAADATGTLTGPHTPGDRITDVELLVCVASDHHDRLQGVAHCSVDRMRHNIANPRGWMPPQPELLVVPTTLTMTETATATLDVNLATEPLSDVAVTVTSSDPGAVSVSLSSLTFTSANWDTAQRVTVTAADDADTSDESVTVELDPSSVDSDYNALADVTVAVTVTDDDTPP